MGKADVAAICKATGLPFANEMWPAGADMPLPCLVYDFEGTSEFYADSRRYLSIGNWSITLYSERRDETAESAIKAAFDAAGITPSGALAGRDDDIGLRWTAWEFQIPEEI